MLLMTIFTILFFIVFYISFSTFFPCCFQKIIPLDKILATFIIAKSYSSIRAFYCDAIAIFTMLPAISAPTFVNLHFSLFLLKCILCSYSKKSVYAWQIAMQVISRKNYMITLAMADRASAMALCFATFVTRIAIQLATIVTLFQTPNCISSTIRATFNASCHDCLLYSLGEHSKQQKKNEIIILPLLESLYIEFCNTSAQFFSTAVP